MPCIEIEITGGKETGVFVIGQNQRYFNCAPSNHKTRKQTLCGIVEVLAKMRSQKIFLEMSKLNFLQNVRKVATFEQTIQWKWRKFKGS